MVGKEHCPIGKLYMVCPKCDQEFDSQDYGLCPTCKTATAKWIADSQGWRAFVAYVSNSPWPPAIEARLKGLK